MIIPIYLFGKQPYIKNGMKTETDPKQAMKLHNLLIWIEFFGLSIRWIEPYSVKFQIPS